MSESASNEIHQYSKSLEDITLPENNLPFGQNIILGVQHVFAMFGATVLGPLLMGFDPNTAILFSGVATLIFYLVVGGKIPSYLGSSFAFISAVTAATNYHGVGINQNIPIALGGIIFAGLLYSVFALIIMATGTKFLNWLFPPVVTGSIVGIIGLNLAKVAVQEIGTDIVGITVGISTIFVIAIIAVFGKGFFRRVPILFGALIGYALYYVWANVAGGSKPIDFSLFESAAWVGLPKFHTPVFDPTAISLIAPVALILVAENLGHVKAIGGMIRRDLDPYMGRAFLADGIATMIAAAGGGTGVTTYAENMGVMRITRNFSSATMAIAGVIAIVLGLSPKFGELIRTIPSPVLGGLSVVVFGLITATAGAIWQQGREAGRVDFDDTRTLIVVGVALVLGAGDFTISVGKFAMGGIVTATVAAILIYHLLGIGNRSASEVESAINPYKS
jgi:putative pyrimidine permease RutG